MLFINFYYGISLAPAAAFCNLLKKFFLRSKTIIFLFLYCPHILIPEGSGIAPEGSGRNAPFQISIS